MLSFLGHFAHRGFLRSVLVVLLLLLDHDMGTVSSSSRPKVLEQQCYIFFFFFLLEYYYYETTVIDSSVVGPGVDSSPSLDGCFGAPPGGSPECQSSNPTNHPITTLLVVVVVVCLRACGDFQSYPTLDATSLSTHYGGLCHFSHQGTYKVGTGPMVWSMRPCVALSHGTNSPLPLSCCSTCICGWLVCDGPRLVHTLARVWLEQWLWLCSFCWLNGWLKWLWIL